MRGLALEGGGARGAYHIGVVKALYEHGYDFSGFVGTSIGAINAAVLAEGNFKTALNIWENITMDDLFFADEKMLIYFLSNKLKKADKNPDFFAQQKTALNIIRNKGLDTSKMKAMLAHYISEKKIRKSGNDFGLVTVSINELKAFELMLEDIPNGQLISYLMASASLPGFRPESIERKTFIDGAVYNSCPVNLLLNRGYDEIIAIRTNAIGIFRKIDDPCVKYIVPTEDLGNVLLFEPECNAKRLDIGYQDGLRFIEEYSGS